MDNPLFTNAWYCVQLSLTYLKERNQRNVAIFTVVKGCNKTVVYEDIVTLVRVGLVEVRGMTFCIKYDYSNLNMSNNPWHHKVVALTAKL